MTYIIIVLMSYFGPNAKLLGNIQLDIWQYQNPILDIDDFVWNVSLLALVDIASFIINGILLWWICKINILKTLKNLQKEFWPAFAITEGFLLMEVKI